MNAITHALKMCLGFNPDGDPVPQQPQPLTKDEK